MWELWMHLDYDHLYIPVYSIPNKANSSHRSSLFLWKNPTVVWVKISEIFSGLRSRYHRQANRKKLWDKMSEIMLLKYGNLMLPAGYILDLYCVRILNAAAFWENYTKLYFDVKHLEKGLNRGEGGVKYLVPFFIKVPFLANFKRCPKFLEYTLTRGISS